MESFKIIMIVLLVVAYIGFAIWVISRRRTVGGSIGASAGFLCGGIAFALCAEAIATFLCWAIVIIIALVILGALFGG